MSAKAFITAVLTVLLAAGVLARTGYAQVETFPERMVPGTWFCILAEELSQAAYSPSPVFMLRPSLQDVGHIAVFPYCMCAVTWDPCAPFCVECPAVWCPSYVWLESPPPGLWSLDYADGEIILEFEVGAWFQRGDANADSAVDISDAISILGFLFLGDQQIPCLDAADTNDSAEVDISDAVWLLQFLFLGTAAPPPPFGECYYDDADALTCESYPTVCQCPEPNPWDFDHLPETFTSGTHTCSSPSSPLPSSDTRSSSIKSSSG